MTVDGEPEILYAVFGEETGQSQEIIEGKGTICVKNIYCENLYILTVTCSTAWINVLCKYFFTKLFIENRTV